MAPALFPSPTPAPPRSPPSNRSCPSAGIFPPFPGAVAPEANCALVCTPPAFHAAQVAALLERKLPVLCEKPLACRGDDAQKLFDAAQQAQVVLQVGYFRRFHPAAQAVHPLLRSGELGTPRRCLMRAGHNYHDAPLSVRSLATGGGGVLIDMGVHILDRLFSWFDQLELVSYHDDSCGGMEANAVIAFQGTAGAATLPVEVHLSRTHELGYHGLLTFDSAEVECPLNTGHALTVRTYSELNVLGRRVRPGAEMIFGPAEDHAGYFCRQFLEFARRIAGGEEAVSSLRHAVRANVLADVCLQQRRKMTLLGGW